MTDIASLGIRVTTDGVQQADADLNKLTATGERAQDSADKTGSAWSRAAKKIQGDTSSIVAELKALNATQTNALASFQGLSAKLDALSGSLKETTISGAATSKSIAEVGESADDASARIKAMVAASLEQQKADLAQVSTSKKTTDSTKAVTLSVQEQVEAHKRAMAAADAYRARSAKNSASSKAAAEATRVQREELAKLAG